MDHTRLDALLAAAKMATMRFPQIRCSQLAFLLQVAAKPGMTQTEICQELGVSTGAISRNVDVFGTGKNKSVRHKSYGLVEVRRDANDERLLMLYLTSKGQIFLDLISELTYGNLETTDTQR